MKLSEIETILDELILRHQNLNEELLTTLLTASGWDTSTIKEAQVLFKQRPKPVASGKEKETPSTPPTAVAVPTVVTKEPASQVVEKVENNKVVLPSEGHGLTFYDSDGVPEKDLKVLDHEGALPVTREPLSENKLVEKSPITVKPSSDSVPSTVKHLTSFEHDKQLALQEIEKNKQEEQKKLIAAQQVAATLSEEDSLQKKTVLAATQVSDVESKNIVTEPVTDVHNAKDKIKEESLITTAPVEKKRVLKESDIPSNLPLTPFESSPRVWSFSKYKDIFHGEQKTAPVEIAKQQEEVLVTPVPHQSSESEDAEEVSLEKTPLTKQDEGLAFLASVMLLVIILILGYMYSNGRL